MFLVVIDAYSKWMEVEVVSSVTTQATVENLIARFGLPEVVVTDNGTRFTYFCSLSSITLSYICKLLSNILLLMCAIQTFKKQLSGSLQTHFLFHYRLTPNTITGMDPVKYVATDP